MHSLKLWLMSLDIIIYDSDWMMADYNFTFILGTLQHQGSSFPYAYYSNNTQNINNDAVLYGIYGY